MKSNGYFAAGGIYVSGCRLTETNDDWHVLFTRPTEISTPQWVINSDFEHPARGYKYPFGDDDKY